MGKVLAPVTGLLMEKVKPRDRDTKRQLRLFQEGNSDLVTVTVLPDLYQTAEIMKKVTIPNCTIDMYEMTDEKTLQKSYGTYCKQNF